MGTNNIYRTNNSRRQNKEETIKKLSKIVE